MSGQTSLGFHWEFAQPWCGCAAELLSPASGGLKLDEWLASGQARVVKYFPHRTVYRVELPGYDFHIKHYRGDRRDWLKSLLRRSKAHAEYDITREVARRGVATLEAVAFGEISRAMQSADSFLVTKTLTGAVTLTSYLEETFPTLPPPACSIMRQRLADALGHFLGRAHAAGVSHGDLHPGNMLIRFGEEERVELYLIDLHCVRLSRPLSWRRSRENLVILNRWFAVRCHRSDRRRAWRAYHQERTDLDLAERPRAREVEEATRISFIQFNRSRDHRCLIGGRHFRKIRRREMAGYAAVEIDKENLHFLVDSSDELFDASAAVLKKSASSAVIEIDLKVAGEVRRVIFKRINATAWTDGPASLFRPTGVLRSWMLGYGLRWRGLPTPRPLAMWQKTRLGMAGDGYLVMDKVADAVNLGEFVRSLDAQVDPERSRRLRALIEETARLVRRMHERGVSHRDLKSANLLISPSDWVMGFRGVVESPAGQGSRRDRVWLIDLVGVRRHGEVGRRRRVRNLMRLNVSFLDAAGVSRSDRLRFLRTYLGWGIHGKEGWKSWWKEVAAMSRAKVERNRRVGRVVG
jgi:tRNA A-37 threonylcarbamoyl transferase component Bud32